MLPFPGRGRPGQQELELRAVLARELSVSALPEQPFEGFVHYQYR